MHVTRDRPLGRVADQNGAGLGELLEQRGGAERITDGHVLDVLSCGDPIDHQRSGGDARLQRDGLVGIRRHVREGADAAVNAKRRQNRPAGIVFVDLARAEHGNEPVGVLLL